jgi:outer membrane protein assembly factor BamB
MVRLFLMIAGVCCTAAPLVAHDWPQWRGPLSNGVSVVAHAPERWSSSEGVLWRADIEGHGISSPASVGNRVYVTTAVRSHRRTVSGLACDLLIGLLSILGVPALVIYRIKCQAPGRTLDFVIFMAAAATVFAFGTLLAIGASATDAGLNGVRDVAVQLARLYGNDRVNFSFLAWDKGTRHGIWIMTSGIALVSLSLIPFLFPTNALVRIAGAIGLVVGVALAKMFIPWAAAYGGRFPTGIQIAMYSPVVVLAGWHLLQALRRMRADRDMTTAPVKGARLAATVPALLAAAIFVSPNYLSARETVTRRVVCLDTSTGRRVWQTDVFTSVPETKSPMNSHATPTPTVVGDTVVAAFGPVVAALDRNGALLWSKTFPGWIENSLYGAASSPVAHGDAVFVSFDREYEARQRSRVIAYSVQNGNRLWSRSPRFAHDGYATPVISDEGERKLLVAVTSRAIAAYDTASGTVAWRLRIPISTPIPTVIVEDDTLYITGGRGGDGYTAAYRLRGQAAPAELWTSRQSPADVSSPVLYRSRLFTISSNGVMVCYDARTGAILWRHRLGSGLGAFYASLVAADGKVYAVRSNGTTYVIAAADRFRLIAESPLDEETYASPAFGGECLFLRTVSSLYCIGNKQ